MSEIRNCVSTAQCQSVGSTMECCTSCQSNMQDNCSCEGCGPIGVSCGCIEDAICLPILADELYDSVFSEKEDIGSLTNLTFTLDSLNPNLAAGQLVCIQQIGISYDFIGLAQTVPVNSQIVINGQTFTLTPSSLFNVSATPGTPINLFDELNGTITLQPPCCCNPQTQPGTRFRVIERNRAFQVANLRIVASGVIGCTRFTATAVTANLAQPGTNAIPLSVFGITNMVFTGRICWPNNRNRMTLTDSYTPNLSVDCIVPTSNFIAPAAGGAGTFTANIDLSFIVDRRLYISSREPVAVFTTPNAVIIKNGDIIG
ncbi:hypothetical protein [Clostridium beijerinckii]|uniref:hypothetical protein n=1 Tax=Clostridium beijerinckii TaxID=1520 RepID=UPI00098C3631|nr:hypothetical protein [Clostridium beijerinckii]MBA8934782.1 hypothetical protein [Clostridium beijerinckii]NRU39180.1 hypothetical protein [Clostridium beijerinckii]NSA97541.1 hypothetical protein [Clostridium beijerinckii]OOM52566.1 hypothetical protein CLOBI_53490 [Clostridium beijerinckii]OOM67561.1 hypothetical protein CLBEIC_40360 [Clostridium beijerinckii]